MQASSWSIFFIKWHKTDNQQSLFQGGGGHAAEIKSQAVAFTKSTDVGHDLSQSLYWPSGELQLVPSETVQLGSVVCWVLVCFWVFFFPHFYFFPFFPWNIIFIIFLTVQCLGARRVSVGDSRRTAIIKIFFSSRLVPLVLL